MKGRFRRVLAMVLAIIMMTSSFGVVSALAAGPEWENQVVTNGKVETAGNDKVQHSKMITQTGENTFSITLTVKTKEDVQQQTVSKDAAVVLVMDMSNSMSDSDIASAKEAAKNFVDEFVKKAGDGQRQVALVEFGSNGKTVLGWTDANSAGGIGTVKSGIDEVTNGFTYESGGCQIDEPHTHEEDKWVAVNRTVESSEFIYRERGSGHKKSGAWYCPYCENPVSFNGKNDRPSKSHTCSTWEVQTETVSYEGKHGIEIVEDGGGTNIEAGLRLANNLLKQKTSIENKYVVLLTDGVPTYYVSDDNETDSTTFMAGSRGGGSSASHNDYHDIYCTKNDGGHTDHGDNIPKQIKDQGAKLYTVSYKNTDKKVNGQSIDNWLASFATQNIAAGTDIFSGLQSIAQIIVNQAQAWILTDPMGEYIDFGANENIARVTNESQDESDAVYKFNTDTNTLSWDLKNDGTRTGPVDGWYTYTLTYSITLDTAAEGFVEGTPYAANKTTTLTYMLTENGELQPDLKSTELLVPTVKGKTPVVPWTIEFYKKDKTSGAYVLQEGTQNGTGKLHDQITAPDGYAQKYTADFYHFVSGNTELTLSSLTANVMRLYYDPDETGVTVNHHYKLTYLENGVVKTSEERDSTGPFSGYVGDPYTAQPVYTHGGQTYALVSEEADLTINSLDADANKNVIDIYYELDAREAASGSVDHVYTTWSYVLKDGKYVLESNSVTVPNVRTFTGKVGDVVGAEKQATADYSGYTYVKAESGNTLAETDTNVSISLSSDKDNKITLYFEKQATEPNKLTVTVNHHYTKTVTTIQDGEVVTTTDPDNKVVTETETVYAGERYTATEKNIYANETYVSDSGNAGKLTIEAVNGQNNVIDLYYSLTETPETSTLTVKHVYRDYKTVTTDPETGASETVLVEPALTAPVTVTYPAAGEVLYAGQKVAIALHNVEGYNVNYSDSDIQAAGEQVAANGQTITIYYDKAPVDNRDEASINVTHTYKTNLKTIVDGKVETIEVTETADPVAADSFTGRAGDSFTPVARYEFEGESYTLKSGSLDPVTLKSGTNDTIELVYTRDASDLVEGNLTVHYVYNTYTMTVKDGVAGYYDAPAVGNGEDWSPEGTVYVGQRIENIPDGAKDGFDPAANNPATVQVIQTGDNTYTFVYNRYIPLEKVSVTVNHHYALTEINTVGESTTNTTHTPGTPVEKYLGESYTANAAPNGYDYSSVTVTEGAAYTQNAQKDVTLDVNGNYVIDFYYTKTIDNSKPVQVTVNHIYKTYDWDGSLLEAETKTNTVSFAGYATQRFTAVPDFKSDAEGNPTYTLESKTATPDFVAGTDYTIVLVEGTNEITIVYKRSVDTRVATDVLVQHVYWSKDSANPTAEKVQDSKFEQKVNGIEAGAWIGNDYQATLRLTDGEGEDAKTYKFDSATPENYTIVVSANAEENVITIHYIREYDSSIGTSVKVNHIYQTRDVYTNQTTTDATDSESFSGANIYVNATFTATEKARTDYIRQTEDAALTITVKSGENVIDIYYLRTIDTTPTPVDPPVVTQTYSITINYLDEATGTAIGDPYYSGSLPQGRAYDVTELTELEFEGYTRSHVEGDVSGTLYADKVINVYYNADEEIDVTDPEPPLVDTPDLPDTGDEDGKEIDIEDSEPPLADVPQTGDSTHLGLLLALMFASFTGLVTLLLTGDKKSRKHNK